MPDKYRTDFLMSSMNIQADTKAVCQLANDVKKYIIRDRPITSSSNKFLRLENSNKIMKVRSTKNILKGTYEGEI